MGRSGYGVGSENVFECNCLGVLGAVDAHTAESALCLAGTQETEADSCLPLG